MDGFDWFGRFQIDEIMVLLVLFVGNRLLEMRFGRSGGVKHFNEIIIRCSFTIAIKTALFYN